MREALDGINCDRRPQVAPHLGSVYSDQLGRSPQLPADGEERAGTKRCNLARVGFIGGTAIEVVEVLM